MADSPQHVAIIMDGNGRWARSRGLPRPAGHRASIKVVRRVVEECGNAGVRYLTLFAFSSENWRRPPDEVGFLMNLFLDSLVREIENLHRNQVRLRFIGDRESLGAELAGRMRSAEALTQHNTGLELLVAVAYGGRWDLVQACRSLSADVAAGRLTPAEIGEPEVAGGEQRISNFLLWNLAYTELYFDDVLWPEFSTAHLQAAFEHFRRRERRFGKTSAQVSAHSDA
jgi:undecaprenyl diphosphate synthase